MLLGLGLLVVSLVMLSFRISYLMCSLPVMSTRLYWECKRNYFKIMNIFTFLSSLSLSLSLSLPSQYTVSDVETLDLSFYNSLKYVLENDPAPLELTFTLLEESFGEVSH